VGQERNEYSVAPAAREVSSRRNFLRLSGVGLAGVALFAASACERTDSTADVKTYGVDSIEELKAVSPVADQRITALGYYEPGDGGGGLFRYVDSWPNIASEPPDPNGGTVITSDGDEISAGRWLRVFEGPINARWFGAKGNGEADDLDAIQRAIEAGQEGDTIYLPRGTYPVSGAVVASKHMVTIDFEGTLVPHGSYDDVLFKIEGDKGSRLRTEPSPPNYPGGYGTNPKIDIKSLWLDGKYQSRGFHARYVDHFSWSRVFISRTNGYAMKLMQVREADIYNLTLDRVSGQMRNGEANFWMSGDHPEGDQVNNIRIWGLNIPYPGGRAVKIDCGSTLRNGPIRNISFYGAQIHYVQEQGLSYAPMDNNIKFITLDNCHSIRFVACNLRLGDTSKGTLIAIGSEAAEGTVANDQREILFIGCEFSGGGAGATGIDNVLGGPVEVYGPPPDMPNPYVGAVRESVLSSDPRVLAQNSSHLETHIEGLAVERDSPTGLLVTSGSAWIPSLNRVLNVPADIVKTGLTTLAANTHHYVYLYDDAGTPDIDISTVAPGPTYKGLARKKGGDNSRRYLGAVLTDNAGYIRPFKSEGNLIKYMDDATQAPFRVLDSGTATDDATVTCSVVVPPTSSRAYARILTAGSGSAFGTPEFGSDLATHEAGSEIVVFLELSPDGDFRYHNLTSGGTTTVDVWGYRQAR
jgi:Pectate lyase superfamily protein